MREKCRWLQCANKIFTRTSENKGDSKSLGHSAVGPDQAKERWKLKYLVELIEKGRSIADGDVKFQTEVDALNVILKIGHQNEHAVRLLIATI